MPPLPTPVFSGSVADALQAAFALPDPDERLKALLPATEAFLSGATSGDIPTLTNTYDQLARDAFPEDLPALTLLDVVGRAAVISLPDGQGVYLFPPDAPPVPITKWNVTLRSLQLVRSGDDLAVTYVTVSSEGSPIVHVALVPQGREVSWKSEEEPDWWFNARDGQVLIAENLQALLLTGPAIDASEAFAETERTPLRTFAVRWVRSGDVYRIDPPPASYASRALWLEAVAQPSNYAALVSLLEALRRGDTTRAAELVTDTDVLVDASNFGLDLPTRTYRVSEATEQTITFRDSRGAFVATFMDGKVVSLRPVGAAP